MSIVDDLIMSMPLPKLEIAPKADFNGMLASSAEKYGISHKLPILQKILNAESGGNPKAMSKKGAMGLMQLMPGTAKALGVKNAWDPAENIDAGVRYFKDQLDAFGDDALALAAYNAGPGNVKKYGGIPPFKETRKYVNKILGGDCTNAQNCGDAVALLVNPYLPDKKLPRGGLGEGQIKELATHYGAPVLGKGDISLESLQSLGAGTIIRMTRRPGEPNYKYGDTHAEIIDVNPQTKELSIKSFTPGKGIRYKPLTQEYINSLPKQVIATNLLGQKMPTDMVADVSGQATPSVPYQQPSPEKERTIGQILGEAANFIAPKEAAAAEPKSWLEEELDKDSLKKPEISVDKKRPPITGGTLQPVTAPDFDLLYRLSAIKDPKAKFELLAKKYFPGVPPESAAKRFGTNAQGKIFYIDENDQQKYLIPDTWDAKTKQFATMAIQPQVILPIIGSLTLGPAGAGLGAAVGTGIDELQGRILGDKPRTGLEVGLDITKNALLASIGDILGFKAGQWIDKAGRTLQGAGPLGRIVAKEKNTLSGADVKKLHDLGKEFGIDLTVPELTNSTTLKGLWNAIAKSPGDPAEAVRNYVETIRMPQIDAAIGRELNRISPVSGATKAGGAGKQAASEILENAKLRREQISSPLYRQAFDESVSVNLTPVIEKIDTIAAKFGPNTDQAAFAAKIRKKLFDKPMKDPKTGEMIERPLTDLETIDNAKDEINAMFKDYEQTKAVGKKQERRLYEIKDILLKQMDEASPLYRQARESFAQASGPVNEIKYADPKLMPKDKRAKSIIQEIIDTPAADLHKVHQKIFSQENPDTIKQARKYFIASDNKASWDAMVRARLDEHLLSLKPTVGNLEEGNKGYNWFKKAFSGIERLNFEAAMGKEEFKRLSDLMEVLQATNRIVYTNSSTAHQLASQKFLMDNVGGLPGIVIYIMEGAGKLRNLAFDQTALASTIKQKYAAKNADKFLELMLQPSVAPKIAEIKALPDSMKKLTEFLGLLTTLYGKEKLEGKYANPKNFKVPD